MKPGQIATASIVLALLCGCGGSTPATQSPPPTLAPPTSLSYSTNPAAYTVGVAIPANAPSTGGGAPSTYSVAPGLPAGLALSSSTGVITGTPAVVTASASYTVTASNSAGSTSVALGVTVGPAPGPAVSVPGAPRNVRATAGDRSASVTWLPPESDGGAPLTGYVVAISPPVAAAVITVVGTNATVAGLTNGTAYTFTVAATNGAGTGPASSPSAAVTPSAPLPPPPPQPGATVPGAPTDVVAATGIRSAIVTWAAPASTGGSAITGYSVTVSPATPAAVIQVTGTTASVTGLANGTSYVFSVTASNSVGAGAASIPSAAVTTPGLPGAPTGVAGTAGNGSVSLTWTAPGSDGGRPITGYTVVASPAAPSAVFQVSGTTASVTGLSNGTPYTFTVSATSAVGTGPSSAPSSALTPVDPPAPPQGLAAGLHVLALYLDPPPAGTLPVSGIAVTLTLPPGASIATESPGSTRISEAALVTGSAITGPSILTGTYVTSTRRARVSLAIAPDASWSGEFVRLPFTVETGATVTAAEILQLNATFAAYKAVGVDQAGRRTVVLSEQARTSLQVVNP